MEELLKELEDSFCSNEPLELRLSPNAFFLLLLIGSLGLSKAMGMDKTSKGRLEDAMILAAVCALTSSDAGMEYATVMCEKGQELKTRFKPDAMMHGPLADLGKTLN